MDMHRKISRLAWRLRLIAVSRRLGVCLLIALGSATLVAATDKLIYLGIDAVGTAVLFVAAGTVAALVWTLAGQRAGKIPADLRAAIEADRLLGLNDRLTSAVQLERSDGPWAEAIARDAADRVRDVRPADVFPFRLPLSMRLLLPAAIVFAVTAVLPPADLLGRMERRVADQVAAELVAERTARAARADSPERREHRPPSEELQQMHLRFFQIDRDLLEGDLDAARHLELSEELRRLARQMREHGGSEELAEAIRETARALEEGDSEAAASSLREAQEELDRLARALERDEQRTERERELARRLRAEMADLATLDPYERPELRPAAEDEELVELTPRATPPEERDTDGGIIYDRDRTGTERDDAPIIHREAREAALREIGEGRVPPGYEKLVRDYFDAIKPADE